jgi:hypothetical protein
VKIECPHVTLDVTYQSLSEFIPGEVQASLFAVSTDAGVPVGVIRVSGDRRSIDEITFRDVLKDRDDSPYGLLWRMLRGEAHVFAIDSRSYTAEFVGLASMYGQPRVDVWKVTSGEIDQPIRVLGPQALADRSQADFLEAAVREARRGKVP